MVSVEYNFEHALVWLRGGRKITRKGWNGKGMFIYLVKPGSQDVFPDNDSTKPLVGLYAEGIAIKFQPRIDMRFANGEHGIWTPTHEDILATDWNLFI
jgi:Protein of unknown function (DUF2829)